MRKSVQVESVSLKADLGNFYGEINLYGFTTAKHIALVKKMLTNWGREKNLLKQPKETDVQP